ncbi:hypothetical protein BGZ57DRAFT_622855 [Hyaloscypha finlandica]|nr:hypothetical protein BGZ57DRAFT_622855 [Hyaloscypha finlandica]
MNDSCRRASTRTSRIYITLCRGTALGFCQACCFLGVTTRTDRQVWPSYDHVYPISAACLLPMEAFHACSSALSVVARGADWLVWERLHLLDAWAPTKRRKDENCSRSLASRKCSHAVCKTTAGCRRPGSGIGAQNTGSGALPCTTKAPGSPPELPPGSLRAVMPVVKA